MWFYLHTQNTHTEKNDEIQCNRKVARTIITGSLTCKLNIKLLFFHTAQLTLSTCLHIINRFKDKNTLIYFYFIGLTFISYCKYQLNWLRLIFVYVVLF